MTYLKENIVGIYKMAESNGQSLEMNLIRCSGFPLGNYRKFYFLCSLKLRLTFFSLPKSCSPSVFLYVPFGLFTLTLFLKVITFCVCGHTLTVSFSFQIRNHIESNLTLAQYRFLCFQMWLKFLATLISVHLWMVMIPWNNIEK